MAAMRAPSVKRGKNVEAPAPVDPALVMADIATLFDFVVCKAVRSNESMNDTKDCDEAVYELALHGAEDVQASIIAPNVPLKLATDDTLCLLAPVYDKTRPWVPDFKAYAMMTKQKAIVVVGKDAGTLTEWARSSACSNDHIESMSDPHIGLYKYLLKEKRLVKVGYDAMLTFNAQKSSSGKRDFMQGIIDA